MDRLSNDYRDTMKINRKKAIDFFSSGSDDEICDALLAITLYDPDWKWVQNQCLELLKNNNPEISGLAATCLGHIARIHQKLDRELVIKILREKLNDLKISGRVQDALDDIEIYLGKKNI